MAQRKQQLNFEQIRPLDTEITTTRTDGDWISISDIVKVKKSSLFMVGDISIK